MTLEPELVIDNNDLGREGCIWRVEKFTIPGGSGWTAEGDGKEYWLEPLK
jgi:hypothetical protein